MPVIGRPTIHQSTCGEIHPCQQELQGRCCRCQEYNSSPLRTCHLEYQRWLRQCGKHLQGPWQGRTSRTCRPSQLRPEPKVAFLPMVRPEDPRSNIDSVSVIMKTVHKMELEYLFRHFGWCVYVGLNQHVVVFHVILCQY
jgi:hypothetical protein